MEDNRQLMIGVIITGELTGHLTSSYEGAENYSGSRIILISEEEYDKEICREIIREMYVTLGRWIVDTELDPGHEISRLVEEEYRTDIVRTMYKWIAYLKVMGRLP